LRDTESRRVSASTFRMGGVEGDTHFLERKVGHAKDRRCHAPGQSWGGPGDSLKRAGKEKPWVPVERHQGSEEGGKTGEKKRVHGLGSNKVPL